MTFRPFAFSLALVSMTGTLVAQELPPVIQFDEPPTLSELSQALGLDQLGFAIVTPGGGRLDKPKAKPAAQPKASAPAKADIRDAHSPAQWVAEQVEFENGSNKILSTQIGVLDLMGSLMKERDDFRLVVSGHANATGPHAINDRLSKERAQAVASYLSAAYDLPVSRFELRWMGAREPLDGTHPADDGNRRVQFGAIPLK